MTWSAELRRFHLGLRTVLGSGRHGYFIPSRSAQYRAYNDAEPYYRPAADIFKLREPTMRDWLAVVDGYAEALMAIEPGPESHRPQKPQGNQRARARWRQDWFPRLDAALLYGFIRHFKPRQIVEVGSGHSTRFAQQAIEDEGLSTCLTAIDPHPRKALSAGNRFTWVAEPVQRASLSIARKLGSGDILLIVSSHVLMPGSDVDLLLNRVIPELATGVIVQFHDVFLPDNYPPNWRWRGYNEQLGIAALLTRSSQEILMSSHYVTTRMAAEFERTQISKLPILPGASENSLWLKIC
jgi:hypothetical protein